MKGYRTVAFNALMLAATVLGVNLAPELLNELIGALATAWATGNIVLRGFTDSPIFKKN